MKCIHLFQGYPFKENRLVYDWDVEKPSSPFSKPLKGEIPGAKKETAREYSQWIDPGKAPLGVPDNYINFSGTFPSLGALAGKLDVKRDTFFTNYPDARAGEEKKYNKDRYRKVEPLLHAVKEAIIFRGVYEGWAEGIMETVFEEKMKLARDFCMENQPFGAERAFLKEFGHISHPNKDFVARENPYIRDRANQKIATVKDIREASRFMLQAEMGAKKEVEDDHWRGPDSDKLEFLEKVRLPAMRENYLQKGIFYNRDEVELQNDYRRTVLAMYNDCYESGKK